MLHTLHVVTNVHSRTRPSSVFFSLPALVLFAISVAIGTSELINFHLCASHPTQMLETQKLIHNCQISIIREGRLCIHAS